MSAIFTCPNCGHQAPKNFTRCPACGRWLESEQLSVEERDTEITGAEPSQPAQPASESKIEDAPRIPTGIPEFDRVLGGGISIGSALLFTGAPGVGKSTLLMQVAAAVAAKEGDTRVGAVLYVSAEESLPQAAARAKRIDAAQPELYILADNGLEETVSEMSRLKTAVTIVDSLQLMRTRYSDTAPGSPVQVKEVSARLTELAKKRGIPILVAGQIVKTGKFAGPMSVPHLYDGVFHLDESTLPGFILLRVEKNRFGSKAEVGSFRMTAHGVEEVPSPSAEILKGGGKGIIAVAMEGTKPIATEIQIGFLQRADFSEAVVGYPRDRLRLIRTILAGYGIEIPSTIALDVLGGYKITDPAADLAVAIAAVFAANTAPAPGGWAAIGEVALDGRLLPPRDFIDRFKEIELLGIADIIVPHIGSDSLPPSDRTQVHRARTLREALRVIGASVDEKPREKPAEKRPEKSEHSGRPKELRETRAVPVIAATKPAPTEATEKKRAALAEKKVTIPRAQLSSPPEPSPEPPSFSPDHDPLLAQMAVLAKKHHSLTADILRRELKVSLQRAHRLLAAAETLVSEQIH